MRLFEFGLNFLETKTKKWHIEDDSIGIVTAADKNVFKGLQVLYTSVKNKINFLCYDLGLTAQQQQWCKDNNLLLKSLSYPADLENLHMWMSYVKPWAITNSPFEYTMWLDTDCIVVGDLLKSELIKQKQTFFTKHFLKKYPKNGEYLYQKFPVSVNLENWNYVNAGVFGVNKKDLFIIKTWQQLINNCLTDSLLLNACNLYWDEGSLNWTLQKLNLDNLIVKDFNYNYPGEYCAVWNVFKNQSFNCLCFFIPTISSPSLFFNNLLKTANNKFIIHFASGETNSLFNYSTIKRTKYFNLWN